MFAGRADGLEVGERLEFVGEELLLERLRANLAQNDLDTHHYAIILKCIIEGIKWRKEKEAHEVSKTLKLEERKRRHHTLWVLGRPWCISNFGCSFLGAKRIYKYIGF